MLVIIIMITCNDESHRNLWIWKLGVLRTELSYPKTTVVCALQSQLKTRVFAYKPNTLSLTAFPKEILYRIL